MASLNITIPQPVLIANQGFLVEYRIQGATLWTLWGEEDNDPFTITGLTDDTCYEVRFTFLQSLSPYIACSPVIKSYCIPPESEAECYTFTAEIVSDGNGGYYIEVAAVLPSPLTVPCGGFKVMYGQSVPYSFFSVADFNTVNPIQIPISSLGTYTVIVQAVNCQGAFTTCFEDEIEPTSPISFCTPGSIVSASVNAVSFPTPYTVTLVFQQSVPFSDPLYISYAQSGIVTSGVPDPGGSFAVAGTNTPTQTITFPVTPNLNVIISVNNTTITYEGNITDGCGYSHKWSASKVFST